MEKVPVIKDEECEDQEGLSRVQSNPQINREIFSDSRIAALCGPNSATLTMSIWTSDEEVIVKILKAAEYGKLILGNTRTRTSSPSKEASWTPKNLQDSCIYIKIGLLGLL